ncbi:barrel-sandwich domain of cusB or hlyD membrane-fusion domain-containing protein [Ditylenchus destructor]|uniref:Barrel-sandwich domain of cusB or hlyD membrane-fusion domain-containing protein n=1 Tax=Ditylenchus destructor TaxID=166010 RepID=A0AAD4MGX6_9BILA|nr:barrel-sandwich domain of cusB or hlyD membrane-fusion domain-containing protein [Ditylenchus destructor]
MRKLENNYQRAQKLVGQQMVSAADVDQLRYDLENVRAQYRLATLELSYTTVVAPISGVIASRSIKTGNFVQINTPIFRIVDNSRLEATLNVPERELATLRAGQPVTLSADALPGQTFTGVVDRIAPVVDSGSGTFRVVSAFDGAAQSLQPGMFGRIRIDYDQRADALVVRAWHCWTMVSRQCSAYARARSRGCRSSSATPKGRGLEIREGWRRATRSSPPARSPCATAPRCR